MVFVRFYFGHILSLEVDELKTHQVINYMLFVLELDYMA